MIAAADEPNLLGELGHDFAAAAVAKTETKPAPVYDVDKRTVTTGCGWSTSTISVEFIPSSENARMELRIVGTVDARMLVSQGPFRICTDGFVRFMNVWKQRTCQAEPLDCVVIPISQSDIEDTTAPRT
jgi:hypothetical protein